MTFNVSDEMSQFSIVISVLEFLGFKFWTFEIIFFELFFVEVLKLRCHKAVIDS
jgi:hypothetical protein